MDFDFKWVFIAFSISMIIAGISEFYKEYNKTQLEMVKINNGKCNCNATAK